MAAWQNVDDVRSALAKALPVFAPILDIAPPAGFRVAGQKIARQPERYSGRTAMLAHLTVHEPKPPDDPDSPLTFSMEGFHGQPPSALIPRFWAPGWNSAQAINKFQIEVGGTLRGGDPGIRLVEPAQDGDPGYFRDVPAAFQRREDEWLVIPLYHIFGSEELSVLTPGIAQQTPEPYVALNADDAARLQLKAGDPVELPWGRQTQRLSIRISSALPPGMAGVPAGLPGMPGLGLPVWARISKVPGE
jgi:NADH-quinone oxidoreductase subunit G